MQQTAKKQPFYADPGVDLVDCAVWDNAKDMQREIKQILMSLIQAEFPEAGEVSALVELAYPKDKTHGVYATNIAMRLSGKLGRKPSEIAESIVNAWSKHVAGSNMKDALNVSWEQPGFVNFAFKPQADILNQNLQTILTQKETYGQNTVLQGKRIMMEYAQPNPFKVIHIGHMRNVFYGESLIRILEAHGAEVIRTNYQGDVGMHVAKSIWGMYKRFELDKMTFSDLEQSPLKERMAFIGKAYQLGATAYEEDETDKQEIKDVNMQVYVVAQNDQIQKYNWKPKVKYADFVKTAKFKLEDIEHMWKKGVEWSLESDHLFFNRVYSTFTREYMESETLYLSSVNVAKAMQQKVLQESQGAIIFDGTEYGLDTRVFVNSLGLPIYEGKEVGLAPLEFGDYGHIDLCIHNVAVEQVSYFKVVFKVLELLDPEKYKGKNYHTAYEFVGLKTGKMSSRKGIVVLANDVIDEAHKRIAGVIADRDLADKEEVAETIGVGAVKYSFLSVNPNTHFAFDLETSLSFEGNSGPYLQYTYARANKILLDYGQTDFQLEVSQYIFAEKEEIELLEKLILYPEVVIEAGKSLNTNEIATYIFDLAQLFNSFYKQHQILNISDDKLKKSRIALTAATAQVIKNGLNLLGIKTVERM